MQVQDRALRRPVTFRLASRALAVLQKARLVPSPDLDEVRLDEAAIQKTGLTEFGDNWFRQPLRILLESLAEEARLNPIGHLIAHVHVVKLLKERLWAEQWFAENPGILRRPLNAPVVVVGPMRSGTTRLHRLLASDRRFAHLRMFETMCPVPDPSAPLNGHDKRPGLAALSLNLLHWANPATAIVHPTGPMEPEEELGLFIASAWGMKHEVQWHVPTYARWCEEQDATPAYARMADLLRLTGWIKNEDPGKPWLLKTPQHMLDLPALLNVFPDARIIFIHRDPAAVVGSSCSMVWNQMSVQSDHADPHWIGREWLRKTRLKIDRMEQARALIPAGQVIDVLYDDMDRDWRGVMARIYDFLDLDIGTAQAGMADYMAQSERDKSFRSHVYSLSSFGLDEEEVGQVFRDYVQDFAVPVKRGSPVTFMPSFGGYVPAAAASGAS